MLRGTALAALVSVALVAVGLANVNDAHAANFCGSREIWVNDLAYGSAAGGFYWDPLSSQVWTPTRGWHYFAAEPPRASPEPLWVDQLDYGSSGGGYYWDPVSGQVWTSERGWHVYGAFGCGQRSVGPNAFILAVAYTDMNENDGTYNRAVDVLIAALVDIDGDRIPSVGDKIITNQYPLDFGATGFGSFTITEHTASAVVELTESWVELEADAGAESFRFKGTWGIHFAGGDSYWEVLPSVGISILQDASNGGQDIMRVDSGSPSGPLTPLASATRLDSVDDAFIDVEIYYDYVRP